MPIHEHVLDGCTPVPLANYLKALGILRLVAQQKDPSARGHWHNDRFVLRTVLDEDALLRFFLEEYSPTPVVAPWNGGSGFHPKDNRAAIEAIEGSNASRLASYRQTISISKQLLGRLGIEEKATGDQKAELLEACRASLPDAALDWLDATYLLTHDGPKYPPLLGTGGNDGRLDFTNNFMQRLLDVIEPQGGGSGPSSVSLLRAALFATSTAALQKAAIGQFSPADAGGANAASGYEGDPSVNPWDFVLMLEGAALFAGVAARRMEQTSPGVLAYPFTVRPVASGYGSASDGDEVQSRAETWMPMWTTATSFAEARALFAEGRARVGGRAAVNSIDFARAVVGLGVDRGVDAFQRYGFQVRNGLAYLAVPLSRVEVRSEARAELLWEIDAWLDAFRRGAGSNTAPASATRALRQVEAAIFALCERGDAVRSQQVLIALGRCEQAMARSSRWRSEAFLRPVPALAPRWIAACDDGSIELRLAASLASVHGYPFRDRKGRSVALRFRQHLEPIATWLSDGSLCAKWDDETRADVLWHEGQLVAAMNATLARRITRAVQSGLGTYPDRGWGASLGDIADFIEARVDEQRLVDLLWGCLLIDWPKVEYADLPANRREPRTPMPSAAYALLKLCLAGHPVRRVEVPLAPEAHRLMAAGLGGRATEHAVRRLRGSGLTPAVLPFQIADGLARRTAAASLFPLSGGDVGLLTQLALRPESIGHRSDEPESPASNRANPQGATP